jgi:hypothetical protein
MTTKWHHAEIPFRYGTPPKPAAPPTSTAVRPSEAAAGDSVGIQLQLPLETPFPARSAHGTEGPHA